MAEAKARSDPVARYIVKLKLATNTIVLALRFAPFSRDDSPTLCSDPYEDDSDGDFSSSQSEQEDSGDEVGKTQHVCE